MVYDLFAASINTDRVIVTKYSWKLFDRPAGGEHVYERDNVAARAYLPYKKRHFDIKHRPIRRRASGRAHRGDKLARRTSHDCHHLDYLWLYDERMHFRSVKTVSRHCLLNKNAIDYALIVTISRELWRREIYGLLRKQVDTALIAVDNFCDSR